MPITERHFIFRSMLSSRRIDINRVPALSVSSSNELLYGYFISSGIWRHCAKYLVFGVSRECSRLISNIRLIFQTFFTLEDKAITLPRNIGIRSPIDASYPSRKYSSATQLCKPETWHKNSEALANSKHYILWEKCVNFTFQVPLLQTLPWGHQ